MTSVIPYDTLEALPILSVEDLNLLGTECPYLETLALDMPRTTEWPSAHLTALAHHPKLRSLTLYTANNTTQQSTLQINTSTAKSLFLRLRALKRGQPLEKLHLNLGEWGRIRYKCAGECLHPMDERCGNLFTCEIEPGTTTGRVVVRDEREVMRGKMTEEDWVAFKQFE
ncbi:MAG: hypothetical protein M1830_006598 [Pleopsidium flavum]|nr:MAG: hypothetical protein M1830_006598 [Pleopsidium flavum]